MEQSPVDNMLTTRHSQENKDSMVSSGGKVDLPYCAVCHDSASGYHYGVWSCEGCKAFFKRTIQNERQKRHNDYICSATNECTINKRCRKSCQACRLRKCYEVGMTKPGTRKECGNYRSSQTRQSTGLSSQGRTNRPSMLTGPAVGLVNEPHPPALTSKQLIEQMMEAEPSEIYLMKDMKRPLTETDVMMVLIHLAEKELVPMISWAKKILGLVELSVLDQAYLLECCWPEVLMFGLVWRSVGHPGKLVFFPDFSLSREEWSGAQGFVEIFDILIAATSWVRELKLQKEEYNCLKAMILLNFTHICLHSSEGSKKLQSGSKVQRLLDAMMGALVCVISKTGLTICQQGIRLSHLYMLLSHIRYVSNKGIGHLHHMKMKNMVPLGELLLEMLDAHIMHNSYLSNCPPKQESGDRAEAPARPHGSNSTPSSMWTPNTTRGR